MLAIEAKRIVKDAVVIFVVLVTIVAGIIATDQDVYLAPALEIFLLLYASFSGWSLFERERQENAVEYMLSLPISRSRLLLLKFLPRLLGVSLLLLAYLYLHHTLLLPSILAPFDFSVLYAAFFLLSAAFAVSFKNFISAFFTTCLLSVGQVLLIRFLDPGREIGQAILQASATILIFPLFFILLFQQYDIKPVSHFNKKFLPGLLLLAGLIAGVVFFTAPTDWKNFTILANGRILKNSCQRSEIVLDRARRRIRGCLGALRETPDGKTLFALTRKANPDGPCLEMSLVALDLQSGAMKNIFQFTDGWSVTDSYPGETGASHDGMYSLFIQNPRLKKAMLLQVRDNQVRKLPVAGEFYDPGISYVLYLNLPSPQVVIYSKPRLYRLDLSGRVEKLAESESINVWRDRMLLFEPAGMSLYQVGENLTPLLQRKGDYKKSLRRIAGYESRGVVYHAGREYFWLDMEQRKEGKLEVKAPPYTYQQSGENFNMVFANGSIFTVREIGPGRQSERVWDPGFQPAGIRISPFGLLVFRDQEYKVYPFND
jgi:hypothetical protein